MELTRFDSQTHIDLDEHPNLTSLLDSSMQTFASNPAFHALGQTFSFEEIDTLSQALAAYFQHHTQLKPGDRIAIQLPNLMQYPIAAFAALRAGLVLVNTNPMYTATETLHQLKDSGATAIVIIDSALQELEKILPQTEVITVITTSAGDSPTQYQASVSSYTSLYQAIDQAKGLPLNQVEARGDDIVLLQYTGGTTGLSKGAMLSHNNLLANLQQTYSRLAFACEEGEETFICPLPLYHIYAFLVNMLLFFSRGNLNVLIPDPRDIASFVNTLKPFQFTGFAGLNTLFVGLCSHPDFGQLDFSKLKITLSGGTALTQGASDIWKKTTGCTISEGWGLSETSPVLTFNPPGHEQLGTVGLPLIDTRIEVWDENHTQVAPGEMGELIAFGPQVMQGYWQQAEATADVLVNGGFKTGDIGRVLENGYIRIEDRKKDLILVSGFNVYPNEVENVISQHPQVMEAAVVGAADDKSGERVVAYVVKRSPELDVENLAAHCQEKLTAYKQPREYHFVSSLPKSAVGKILRRKLRQ